jgi:hypothetical protein
MNENKAIYICLRTHRQDVEKHGPNIGFLPFGIAPPRSILWKALRDGEIDCEDGGFRGIYHDIKYAKEHMKLENWKRGGETLAIQ